MVLQVVQRIQKLSAVADEKIGGNTCTKSRRVRGDARQFAGRAAPPRLSSLRGRNANDAVRMLTGRCKAPQQQQLCTLIPAGHGADLKLMSSMDVLLKCRWFF